MSGECLLMLTAPRGVTSHEDAPTCLFSKEVWRKPKGVGVGMWGILGVLSGS